MKIYPSFSNILFVNAGERGISYNSLLIICVKTKHTLGDDPQ